MYQVIADAKDNIQKYELSGTIDGVPFSGDNVLRGSFKISDQCSDSSNFDIGYVHIGTLSATFMNVNIQRNDWKGIEIRPFVTIGETTVPLGVWYVDSADHEGNLHDVKCYNSMAKLDKPSAFSVGSNGTPYDILFLLCQDCRVEFGMGKAEVEALPNGNIPLIMHTQSDIETWRDVLYWVAKTLCSFATIDRQGRLVLKTFHSTIDDEIPADVRFMKSSYGDEVMTYTGIYVNVEEEEQAKYYAADPDDGYSLSIGSNPFLQGNEASRLVYVQNILAGLSNIQYNFCKVSLPFGIHYDLGDVLSFPGGSGSATNKFCIMQYSWTFGGAYEMRGIPVNKKGKSKSDKDIQGLLNKVSKDEVSSYEVKNTTPIEIGPGETQKIASVRMVSGRDTKAEIQIEIDLKTASITPAEEYELDEFGKLKLSDIWQGISDAATKGLVTYLINSEEAAIHPKETWIDGDHVLHLQYILGLSQGIATNFDVYMKSTGGTITIPRGGAWLFAQGVGLLGDGKWDGLLNLEDETTGWIIADVTFVGAGDAVAISLDSPITTEKTDAADAWTISDPTYSGAGDRVEIEMHTAKFYLITEAEEQLITEDGNAFVTEND